MHLSILYGLTHISQDCRSLEVQGLLSLKDLNPSLLGEVIAQATGTQVVVGGDWESCFTRGDRSWSQWSKEYKGEKILVNPSVGTVQ